MNLSVFPLLEKNKIIEVKSLTVTEVEPGQTNGPRNVIMFIYIYA